MKINDFIDNKYFFKNKNLVSFLMILEDRDLLLRKSLLFNPLHIAFRKYLVKTEKHEYGKEYNIVDQKEYAKRSNKSYMNDFFPFSWYMISTTIGNLSIFLPRKWRGYGTIPQQLVRVHALKNFGTYDRNKIRRKIFVEYIYAYYFYKSLEISYLQKWKQGHYNIKLDDYNDKDFVLNLLKGNILLSYFNVILNYPTTIDQFIDSMRKKARTSKSRDDILELWNSRYSYTELHYIDSDLYYKLLILSNAEDIE